MMLKFCLFKENSNSLFIFLVRGHVMVGFIVKAGSSKPLTCNFFGTTLMEWAYYVICLRFDFEDAIWIKLRNCSFEVSSH